MANATQKGKATRILNVTPRRLAPRFFRLTEVNLMQSLP